MSWIIGFLGAKIGSIPSLALRSITPAPIYRLENPQLYIALGGIQETCFFGSGEEGETNSTGWAVVGLGIKLQNGQARFLASSDWNAILSQAQPDFQDLDGHFLAIRWQGQNVQCFTDQLGLRTLYFTKFKGGVYFSTRLDWLSRCTGKHEVDFEAFGSRWLTFNQLSYESCISGIERLGPGGFAEFESGSIKTHRNTPWVADFEITSDPKCTSVLRALIAEECQRSRMSLGLSGGIDSRVLLSVLCAAGNTSFSVHTFGDPSDPDVRVSQEISTNLGLKRYYFNDPIPSVEDCISMIREFVGQTILIEPVSSFLKLRYYPKLRALQKTMIDGGFGEIARRQYLNRIMQFGRNALRQGDLSKLYKLMHTPRAPIFRSDISKAMECGTLKRIAALFEGMPPIDTIGYENFLDLLAIRTRFPNYGGPEQGRLDGQIVNYMPFAQPSFLRGMFRTPIQLRRNGKLFRAIIRENKPLLARFPLVKFGTIYPFVLPTIPSWILTKVKSRTGFSFRDTMLDDFLMQMAEFIQDTVHSNHVMSHPAYDHPTIVQTVERYYRGERLLAKCVDWWLSFEMWRQSLGAA